MSTQQLIEKGEADGTPNICKFDNTNVAEPGHSILTVSVLDSPTDAVTVGLAKTIADVTTQNGYIPVLGKVFAIPQSVQAGSGPCLNDVAYENNQRTALRNSLATLRATK